MTENFESELSASEREDDLDETLLLKDWSPRPIHQVPETEVEKAKYPVINVHAHDYAGTEAEVDEMVEEMDEVGIEKTVILTMATGEVFEDIYHRFSRYPDRFEVWCGLDYSGYEEGGFGPEAVAELERCHEIGATGVGELGDKGRGLMYCSPEAEGMHPDDPRLDPIFEKCAELDMPVNLHTGEPKWMYEPMDEHNDGLMRAHTWRVDQGEETVGHEGMFEVLENTVQRHPDTTFVSAHFSNMSYDLRRLGRFLDRHDNVYVDLSARFAETATVPREAKRFYREHRDRILYGTDMGWETCNASTKYGNETSTVEMYRLTFRILETEDEHFYNKDLFGYSWPLYGLGLEDDVLKKVYRENAKQLMDASG